MNWRCCGTIYWYSGGTITFLVLVMDFMAQRNEYWDSNNNEHIKPHLNTMDKYLWGGIGIVRCYILM
jgi:hypothetical protein